MGRTSQNGAHSQGDREGTDGLALGDKKGVWRKGGKGNDKFLLARERGKNSDERMLISAEGKRWKLEFEGATGWDRGYGGFNQSN